MTGMGRLAGLLVTLAAVALAFARPAVASCAPPAPVAENTARAAVVVHGTVTSASGGAITLRVDRVLKGSAGAILTVYAGPQRGGSGGTAVATSVDYSAEVSTDHVIYAVRAEDGQLETNACIGSHAGAPTAEEAAFFGAGASPFPGGESGATVGGADALADWSDQPWVVAAALVVLLATIVLGSRVLAARSTER